MKKVILLILTIIVSSCGLRSNNEIHKSRKFSFNYNVELKSSEGKKIELWLPVPRSNEVQKISNLKFKTDGLNYEVKDEKEHSNKYVYIYSEGTFEDKNIQMIFNVSRNEHSGVDYKNTMPEQYLLSSSTVPTGAIFNKVINDNDLIHVECPTSQARKVYNYVLSGMHYGKPESIDSEYYQEPWLSNKGKYGMKQVSRDKVVSLYKKAKANNGNYTFGNGNSLYACDIGVGNCTDYHSYFMSLSRTLDIPSRFHMGFSIPTGKEGDIGGYHCWADYYIDQDGWYPVDISEADKNPEKIDYFFGTVDFNRVEMMVGRDFNLDEYGSNPINLFIYPLLEIEDKNSKNFTKNFSFKEK